MAVITAPKRGPRCDFVVPMLSLSSVNCILNLIQQGQLHHFYWLEESYVILKC